MSRVADHLAPLPTGWTEEMEAVARRAPPPPPPRRRLRAALRVSAWSIGFTVLLAAVGVLLFIHRGDAAGSARIANRELEFMLQPGEGIEWRSPVTARQWWDYFRVTHGVLAASDRRLLYVGVPPEQLLPREPEPQLLEQGSFPYDRPIDIWRGRVFLGTVPGIVIRSPGEVRTFGVASGERRKLDSVLVIMTRRQKEIRDLAERQRQAALDTATVARRPVYHAVRPGEALELLARRYGVTVEQIQLWNNLSGSRIRAGDRLLVKTWT